MVVAVVIVVESKLLAKISLLILIFDYLYITFIDFAALAKTKYPNLNAEVWIDIEFHMKKEHNTCHP